MDQLVPKVIERMFYQYSYDLEGVYSCPYADVKRLVTTGMGHLIDPIERALRLPWRIGERAATEQEIRNDWETVRRMAFERTDEQMQKWTATQQAQYTSIRLRAPDIDALTERQLRANLNYVLKLIPKLLEAPADAILGTMSLAWAVGAGFHITKPPRTQFILSANAGDWRAAAAGARLREAGNRGVIERNVRQALCFENAARVVERGLEHTALWWPNACPKEDSLHTLAVKALELGIAVDSTKKP